MASVQTELVSTLDDTLALLQSCGERHWAKWLAGDRAAIASGSTSAISHLLSAFGGMGSFNDLYLSPANGHVLAEADVSTVNANLDSLRSRLYDLAYSQR